MTAAAQSRQSPSSDHVVVDPAIAAVIGNAAAPAGVPRVPRVPRDIPGNAGIFWAVRNLVGMMRDGVDFFVKEGLLKYGEIYTVEIAGKPVIGIWDADEVHKILKNDEQVWSSGMGWDLIMLAGLDARGGNAGTLVALDFDDHRAARKLVQPAFTLGAIKGYLAVADRGFSPAIDRWMRAGRVDFKREIRELLAAVAGEIFTGIKEPARIDVIARALRDFWGAQLALVHNPLISPTFRRARRGFETLRSTFLALVPERRKTGGDDLFSVMCQVEDREGLSDEALVRIFLTVMFGAFDTTSAAMASMAYLLAKHPEWQERLRAEARQIPLGELDASAMKGLRELDWAWKETLRLMPVASAVPRRSLREVVVAGRTLPAGAYVMPMIGGMGRHPKWWKAPDRFDPERFSPERAEDRQHPGIYNPFGGGPHACVGMQLANFEAKAFWHKLLHTCRFSLEKDYEARHTLTPLGCVSGAVSLRLEAV
jgi:cytochrome P450